MSSVFCVTCLVSVWGDYLEGFYCGVPQGVKIGPLLFMFWPWPFDLLYCRLTLVAYVYTLDM